MRTITRLAMAVRLAKKFSLAEWGLEGLAAGRTVTLYHGSSRSFKRFDLSKSRDELVENFYGKGIFLSPSKVIARRYSSANRNMGLDPSVIGELKSRNKGAGEFLEALYRQGRGAWPDTYEGMEALEQRLGGVDGNDLMDIASYIEGSKVELGASDAPMLFSQSSGAPDWLYDGLDALGLDSSKYRPKIYTVSVRVNNPLITASASAAKKARSKGYDSVVFYGSNLVDGVPEVAVFDPSKVKITKVESAWD